MAEDSALEVENYPFSRSGGSSEACSGLCRTQTRSATFDSICSLGDQNNLLECRANTGPTHLQADGACQSSDKNRWLFGKVLDPRSKHIQKWNRIFLLVCAIGLAIDPLFFYVLSISEDLTCLYMDGRFGIMVAVLRSAIDALHLWHIWLQLKLAYVSKESLVVGCGKLVWDARTIALNYLQSVKGFWFDIFVILPIPQALFWFVEPDLIRKGQITFVMTVLLLVFLFQYLPKVYHSICLMKRTQRVTGYVYGTVWWGFALNLIAYFIASHVAGGCWADIEPVWSKSEPLKPICLNGDGAFRYGIYKWALPLVTSTRWSEKILYPIFWGMMTLSTFGNDLEPTSHWLEVAFSIVIVLCGLLLFTLLIGNIQVLLHAATAKNRVMQLKIRDLEWWMRRRQLPSGLRHRVRRYERQRWAATRGVDEIEMISELPEGLRRDIKRHLCLDLVLRVPLFHDMDDLILDNICDRVKPLLFTKGEKILREGDPVQRMVFIVRGHLQSNQKVSKGVVSSCMLGPGNFFGDELLSWCLLKPFRQRLPASSATFTSVEVTEAFGLDAQDLKYVTEHFTYKFADEKLMRTARFYSSSWRTWAAVTIQLAWRKLKARSIRLPSSSTSLPFGITNPLGRSLSDHDRLHICCTVYVP